MTVEGIMQILPWQLEAQSSQNQSARRKENAGSRKFFLPASRRRRNFFKTKGVKRHIK